MSTTDHEQATTGVFHFQGQTPQGAVLRGTLEAPDVDAARGRLAQLGLRVLQLTVAAPQMLTRPLSGEQLLAFNDHLARLTAAGLPLEQGLRVVADELGRGKLQHVVRDLADRLDRGESLENAFAAHADRFPPLYTTMLSAGARTGRLPALLLECGKQEILLRRLRRTVTRAMAYPFLVAVMLMLVMLLLGEYVLPQFAKIYEDFDTELPALTKWVFFGFGPALGPAAIGLGALLISLVLMGVAAIIGRTSASVRDLFWGRVPIIGGVVRHSAIARWCSAAAMAVDAGLDLPSALTLAANASGSIHLRRDTQRLVARIEAGQALDASIRSRWLPATAVFTLGRGGSSDQLGDSLRELALASSELADDRVEQSVDVLVPASIAVLGAAIFLVVIALFLPLLRITTSLT